MKRRQSPIHHHGRHHHRLPPHSHVPKPNITVMHLLIAAYKITVDTCAQPLHRIRLCVSISNIQSFFASLCYPYIRCRVYNFGFYAIKCLSSFRYMWRQQKQQLFNVPTTSLWTILMFMSKCQILFVSIPIGSSVASRVCVVQSGKWTTVFFFTLKQDWLRAFTGHKEWVQANHQHQSVVIWTLFN